MKTLKYIFIVLIAGFLSVTSSCKKEFYTDVNENPNSPPNVVPYVLLSTVENGVGFTITSTHSLMVSLFMQQTFGFSRQSEAYYQYIVTSQDVDDQFGNWYAAVMENNKKLMELADSKGDNAYSGISRILMAFSLQQVVDAWAGVPYSQALKGVDNLHPAYDNDKDLYGTIAKLVDDGISYLGMPVGPDKPSTHGDDIIYNGNASKWIKFGHAIKARLYIHQSKGDVAMANAALAEVNQSFTSNDDNAVYKFGSDETAANARYLFNEYRGDIDFPAGNLGIAMDAKTDPRYNELFDSTYNDINFVGLGAYYGEPDAVAELITYEELQLIKAEAILRSTGDFTSAQIAFQNGIQASMDKLGISSVAASSYIASNGTLPTTSVNDAIAAVAYECWVSLFMNPEEWSTWRRTNAPALTPIKGTQIPRRFPYSQTEYTFNGANTPTSTLYSPKVFWDK